MINTYTENIKKNINNKPTFFVNNSNEYKKYQNHNRNLFLSTGLNHYALTVGMVPLFLTLTCENNNDNKGLSKNELNDKFNYIRKFLEKKNIINFGIKSLELTKNNIYHLHTVMFCFNEDIEKIKEITQSYFKNEINKNELSFQKVIRETNPFVLGYINKIEFKNDIEKQESNLISYSEISFYGIEKIIKEYDRIYKKDFSEIDFERYQRLGILDNIKRDLKINHLIKSKKLFTALAELGVFTKISKKIISRKWKQQKLNSQKIRKLFSKKLTSLKKVVWLTLERGNQENTYITKKERLNYLSYIPPPFLEVKERFYNQKSAFLNTVIILKLSQETKLCYIIILQKQNIITLEYHHL
ncbi:rolling circle replication-associated protein [Acetobacter cibinongensis]|uniref:Replication-associated protein ORF2/G2P domain-containing protein n=1 Tax=Acetobacter cibinongensis TaxID=146475 RepID=A0A1Z5YYZ8_9PROT|nr:hypothetical protein [Acetobacter cibinongensis]OUJ04593.1 hypothetical protein HK14_00075 [Acetobacter cibinongensis]